MDQPTFELDTHSKQLLVNNLPEGGKKLISLKAIKNELIGSKDIKQQYFDMGVIECLMPLIQDKSALNLLSENCTFLTEIIAILNSYFFDFP
jgi:hypothetical protein